MTMALIFVGAALLASDPAPSFDGIREATVVKVADYTIPAVKRKKRLHAYRHYSDVRIYPLACEAVRFPRSRLCADRPYQPSYYDYNDPYHYYYYGW